MRMTEKAFFAAIAYTAALGAFTVAILIGAGSIAFRFVEARAAFMKAEAQANREFTERLIQDLNLRSYEPERTGDAERYLLPEPEAETKRERPEDRRTWANAETPIPQERLDAFLDKPEPVIPY